MTKVPWLYSEQAEKGLAKSFSGFLFFFFLGQISKPLSLTCPDLQDPFSLTEKPPAEFCLSPDGNSEAISIDILQKKGTWPHPAWSRDPAIRACGAGYHARNSFRRLGCLKPQTPIRSP